MGLKLNALDRLCLTSTIREGLLLHEHVHAVDTLVVLFQTLSLLSGESQFLVLQLKQPAQIVAVCLQLLISLLKVLTESLLDGQVSLQSANLSIEVVQLILLSALRLHLHVKSLLEAVYLCLLSIQLTLQLFNPFLKHPTIGIVS